MTLNTYLLHISKSIKSHFKFFLRRKQLAILRKRNKEYINTTRLYIILYYIPIRLIKGDI